MMEWIEIVAAMTKMERDFQERKSLGQGFQGEIDVRMNLEESNEMN